MSKGTNLNNPVVRQLARRWQAMMKFLTCSDEQIYESLIKMYQEEGVEAVSYGAMDTDTLDFQTLP